MDPITFSASKEPYKDKGYFRGFKPKDVKSLHELAGYMKTHALCTNLFDKKPTANKAGKYPVKYRKTTTAVVGTGNLILIDVDNGSKWDKNKQCDSPITLKQITKAIRKQGWCAVIIESKSSSDAWRKYHIAIPTTRPLPSYKTKRKEYRLIYAMIAHELDIRCDMAMQSGIQNMTPSLGQTKYKIIKGDFIDTRGVRNRGTRGFAPRPIPKHSRTLKNDSNIGNGWDFATLPNKAFKAIKRLKVGDRTRCPNRAVKHSKNKGDGYGFINDYGGITCNGCNLNYMKASELSKVRRRLNG